MRKETQSGAGETPPFWTWNEPSMDTVMKAYESWATQWGRLQDESLRFMRRRMERGVEAANRLAACKTPAELLEAQMQFAGESLNEYVSEGQKLMAMVARSANFAVAKEPHKEA